MTALRVIVSCCYDGRKVCPFFSWDHNVAPGTHPLARCGAEDEGTWRIWKPKSPVKVPAPPDCPLREGPLEVGLDDDPVS